MSFKSILAVYPHSGPKNYLQTVKIASAFMKEGSVGQSKCTILLWGETTNSDTQHTAPLLLRIPTVVGFHFLFQLSHGNPLPTRIALDWLGWLGQGGRQSTQTYHVRQTFGSSLPGNTLGSFLHLGINGKWHEFKKWLQDSPCWHSLFLSMRWMP